MLELILCSTGQMAVIGCVSYYILDRTKNENGQTLSIPLVPGGIPLLGHVQGIDRHRPHMTLCDRAKRYGDLFRFKVLREDSMEKTLYTVIGEKRRLSHIYQGNNNKVAQLTATLTTPVSLWCYSLSPLWSPINIGTGYDEHALYSTCITSA